MIADAELQSVWDMDAALPHCVPRINQQQSEDIELKHVVTRYILLIS